eukprot:701379-Prorocentrum_minimum.AAC.2
MDSFDTSHARVRRIRLLTTIVGWVCALSAALHAPWRARGRGRPRGRRWWTPSVRSTTHPTTRLIVNDGERPGSRPEFMEELNSLVVIVSPPIGSCPRYILVSLLQLVPAPGISSCSSLLRFRFMTYVRVEP